MKQSIRSRSDVQALVYSYLRFSDPKQKTGDSVRRQTANRDRWLKANPGVTLDTTLALDDEGRSGFRRKNWETYALAQFVKHIESGRVPRGSYLLVENLDRLTREEEVRAVNLFTSILLGGVRIVQLMPDVVVYDDKADGMHLMRAVMELSLGHRESLKKSERLKEAWVGKRDAARAGGVMPPRKKDGRVTKAITNMLPAWVRVRKDGEMELIPERARTVKRILKLAADGYGAKTTCARLKAEGHVPFGRLDRWTKGYVHAIVADRRALGEYQPRDREDKPVGDPIPGYYPAAVSEAEWNAAQNGLAGRRHGRKPGSRPWTKEEDELVRTLTVAEAARQTERSETLVRVRRHRLGLTKKRGKKPEPGEPFVNPFRGLLREARTGERYMVVMRSDVGGRRRVLVKSEANDERSPCYSFPYPVFEEALLSELREVKPEEVLGGKSDDGPDEVAELRARLARVELSIARLNDEMDRDGEDDELMKRLRAKSAEKKGLTERLAREARKAANPVRESWAGVRSLIDALDKAPDKADARTRLKAAIRRVVDGIHVLVVPRNHYRLAAVQVNFVGGARRNYLVFHRPAKSNGRATTPGGWCARSVRHEFPGEHQFNNFDLTDADHGMESYLENYPQEFVDRLIEGRPLATPEEIREHQRGIEDRINAEVERLLSEQPRPDRPPAGKRSRARR